MPGHRNLALRRSRCVATLLAFLVLMAWSAPSSGAQAVANQAAATGSLAGTVVDPSGAVIPGATVTVRRGGAPSLTATSDSQGNFSVPSLAVGEYTVEASATGFRSARQARVTIAAGHARKLTLTLAIEVQQQQVTVNADQLDSSPDKNADAIVLKGSDLDALSQDPDDLQNELQAMAGSDPDAGTQFYVDGFSGGRLPPKSAIREIRINQNPYSAQYDEIGFGRVEIFTKPGSDHWHGDLWSEGNDSSFNSRNPFVTTQPPYHSWNLYGDVNGPVTKHSSQYTELWSQR
ncbi:MAG: carboxypeptidase regulatory-like domain-containing protein, partial [Acidobacteriaceae bacterium]